MKKTAGIIMALTAIIICLYVSLCAFSGWRETEMGFAYSLEKSFKENMPFSGELSFVITGLKYKTGVRYFDGTYIGEDGSLLKDISVPSTRTLTTAKNYMISVAERNRNTYFCLIPTAAVIRQQEIADYAAENLVNQRHIINDLYSELYGKINTVDVYQTLFTKRNEYIYYHTEDIPTCLGGYYIYSEIAQRMGVRDSILSSFSAYFTAHGFYGSLATDEIKRYATGDYISLYEYEGDETEYMVTHIDGEGNVSEFPELYIYDTELYEDKTDMILGGLTAVTVIRKNGMDGNNLLVFCDDTAKSWLPFMASCYDSITAVDITKASDSQLEQIKTEDYADILFAYGIGSFSDGIDFSRLEKVQ